MQSPKWGTTSSCAFGAAPFAEGEFMEQPQKEAPRRALRLNIS
jgi:hypothetical protein